MNILIIGEFSAFAKHLKNGFKQLGHNVTIVKTGDGWKKIEGDSDDIYYENNCLKLLGLKIPGSKYIFALKNNRYITNELNKRFCQKKIDLIFVVNYAFLRTNIFTVGVHINFIKKSIVNGTKLIMSACGGDPALYYTYPDYYKMIGVKEKLADDRYSFLLNFSDILIPTCYMYWYSSSKYCDKFGYRVKINKSIPLPITIEKKYVFKSCVGNKIIIFHGINRPINKGTSYIQEAMNRLQNDYPELVKCICKGQMAYSEYVKLFDEIDILVDQTSKFGNGWGINAAIGAMKAKCVLTVCKKENGEQMEIPHIPFIYIEPDSNQIYETLKELVLNPERIDTIKKLSRETAEKFFDCKIIAQKYLNAVNLIEK